MNDRSEGPFSGVGPKGYERPPGSLQEQVCEALKANGYVDASEVDIEVKGDSAEVILTGTVPTEDQKRLAEECVVSVQGIGVVHNRLGIGSDTEDSAHDGSSDFGREGATPKRPARTLGNTPEKPGNR